MRIIENFSPDLNFWDQHIQLSVVEPIKELYDSDKSRNKAVSSKLMWCIALIWDQNSKLYNLPEIGTDSKIDVVFTDYYGDLSYFKKYEEKILKLKSFYLKLQETSAQRTLREIEEKLEERARFLKDTKYQIGIVGERGNWVGNTASIIDKMLADTPKIYDLYEKAKKAVASEKNKDERVKGGGNLSLSDLEEI